MYIYSLSDPRSMLVRYIGQTNHLNRRYATHLCESKVPNTHKRSWIKGLLNDGLKPIMEVIEEVEDDAADFLETFHIGLFRSWGFKLTNLTLGGDGCPATKETKEKMSESRKGKMTGIDNQKSKPVAQIDKETGEILSVFASARMACIAIGAPLLMVGSYFQRKRVHGGGYDWKRLTREEFLSMGALPNGSYKYIPLVQKVAIIATKSGVDTHFDSFFLAAATLGLQTSNIMKCMKGTRTHSGGYSFRYA